MKRLWSLMLAAALALSLAACGASKAPFDVETTAQSLVEAPGVFSEELERLDTEIAVGQYALGRYLSLKQCKYYKPIEATDQYGIGERDDMLVTAYHSTGATAEEVAVIRFGSEEDAREYEAWAQAYLAQQLETNRDYRPQEVPKLEKAVAERRGETFLILVCADYEAAQAILERSGK